MQTSAQQLFSLPRLVAVTITTIFVSGTFAYHLYSWHRRNTRSNIRKKLPPDLDTWRMPGNTHEAEEKIWTDLDPVFRDRGYILWSHAFLSTIASPNKTYPLASGFAYATSGRGIVNETSSAGTVRRLIRFDYINPLIRIARTPDGHDVAVRVIVIKNEGKDHLNILRKIATGPTSLLSENHTLPMFTEFHFDDIVFGIFPRVGASLSEAYDFWAKNSVGDIVDMLLQALEGLTFIHELRIAHRVHPQDAFRDNFLVQWQPESMRTMSTPISRPRVYLIDFEVAIEFPPESPREECVCTGYPLGGSFPKLEMYSRPPAPEMITGGPYCPFNTDVWQLGISFSDFRTTVTDIDQILEGMTNEDPQFRLGARETTEKLRSVVNAVIPETLLINPKILPNAIQHALVR